MKEKNKKKIVFTKPAKIGLIIASIVAICSLIGIIIVSIIMVLEPSKEKKKPEIKEDQIVETEKEYSLELLKSIYGYYCTKKDDTCSVVYDRIPTSTPDAVALKVDEWSDEKEPGYILYYDDKMYLYDYKNKTKEVISIDYDESDKMNYTIIEEKDKATAIIYYKNNTETNGPKFSGYYDLTKKKVLYKDEYDAIYTTEYNDYIQVEVLDEMNEYDYRYTKYFEYIELSTGEKYFRNESAAPCAGLYIDKYDKKTIYTVAMGCTVYSGALVYDSNKKIIGNEGDELNDTSNGYIYFNNKDTVYKYDIQKETYDKLGTYNNLLDVIYGHMVYIKDNKVIISNTEEEYELFEWKPQYFYHSALSGYFEKDYIPVDSDKAEGIYMTFEYDGSDEGPGVEYFFNPETKEIKKYELEHIGGYAKPVLYLYPEKTTEVTVNFEKEDNLTTTYPKFKDEWKVKVKPNGDMYDEDGKYYYGLYWEENLNHKVNFSEGFYVSKENAIPFLEEKLSYIGLNDKERNEFIMYWLPIIEKNEHNLIYFELTEERENFNKLLIEPKPDSLLRLAIHVKKVNGPQNIKEQKLTKFDRKGFSAIEWGGISYN